MSSSNDVVFVAQAEIDMRYEGVDTQVIGVNRTFEGVLKVVAAWMEN